MKTLKTQMTKGAVEAMWDACQAGVRVEGNRRVGLYVCGAVFHDKLLIINPAPTDETRSRDERRDKWLAAVGFTILNFHGPALTEQDVRRHAAWPTLSDKEIGTAWGRAGTWAKKAKANMGRRHHRLV